MSATTQPIAIDTKVKPEVFHFFDEPTNTFTYVVKDPTSDACAVVDSVMDIDYAAGRTNLDGAKQIVDFIKSKGWHLEWIIETHVHADHLSAAPYIQSQLGGKLGIGERIDVVQETFGNVFNAGTEFKRDGSQFDKLFQDGEHYKIGNMTALALHTPGHTPACMTHVIGDAAFVGDTIFMPVGGSARADFPGGDARILYRSIKRVLSMPDATRLFMCHDYPDGRELAWKTTVGDERKANIHVHDGISEDEFVAMREARDKTLDMPRLILPSLQVNMRAGHTPPPEPDGKIFLRVPLNLL
jgi:glyoxylase-like metal-dependent hydrolase (beta-lactamase superfamily II)